MACLRSRRSGLVRLAAGALALAALLPGLLFAQPGDPPAGRTETTNLLLRATALEWQTTQSSTLLRAVTTSDREQAPALLHLRRQILDLVDPLRADVAVAVLDLQSGDLIHINGRSPHVTGSVIKVWITLAAWQQMLAGNLAPNTVERLLHGVLIQQSNLAAGQIVDLVGFPAVQAEIDAFGAHRTVLAHHPGDTDQQAPGFTANSNLSTAIDGVRTLAALWNGGPIDQAQGRAFLERWDGVHVTYGFAGGLPPEARLRHKIGWIIPPDADPLFLNADVVNDVGVVQLARGAVVGAAHDGNSPAYAIAVYTQFNLNQHDAWRLIAQISRLTWDYFNDVRYPPPPSPAG